MDKTDTINLHKILAVLKEKFLENGIADNSDFTKYNAPEINPIQIYKPKKLHEQAVKILAKELAQSIQFIRK